MKRTIVALALATLALTVASCSTQRPPPRPTTPARPPAPVAPAIAASPADYVAAAASIDLFVVRASDMALARGGERNVAVVARRLADEHRGLAAQLSMAGRRLDALPRSTLAPRDEQRLARLAASAAFDTAYLVQMHAAHDRSLALHAAFAQRGSSATLRPVAANGARVERAHLALLGRGRA